MTSEYNSEDDTTVKHFVTCVGGIQLVPLEYVNEAISMLHQEIDGIARDDTSPPSGSEDDDDVVVEHRSDKLRKVLDYYW